MALPSSRKAGLRAGRQMQVDAAKSRLRGRPRAFHLLFRQAILRVASRRIRSDFLPRRRGGESAGKRRRWAFFNSLFILDLAPFVSSIFQSIPTDFGPPSEPQRASFSSRSRRCKQHHHFPNPSDSPPVAIQRNQQCLFFPCLMSSTECFVKNKAMPYMSKLPISLCERHPAYGLHQAQLS